MSNKSQIAMTCGILLAVALLIVGCDVARVFEQVSGCYQVGSIKWCKEPKERGNVERRNDSIVLHHSKEKTQMWGNVVSANFDCVFVLSFDSGMSDSSIGLEIWAPSEYSITFRGGAIKVVAEGKVAKAKKVESYVGKRIEVSFKASDKQLFAAIDGVALIDEQNTYWKGRSLKPRLNADVGDTITLYSSSCTTR